MIPTITIIGTFLIIGTNRKSECTLYMLGGGGGGGGVEYVQTGTNFLFSE